MRYQYVVILKKNSERATDLLSILLCFLSAGCFLLIALRSIEIFHFKGLQGTGSGIGAPASSRFIAAIALIVLAGLTFNLFSKRKDHRARVRYRYLLILAAIGWMSATSLPWIGLLFFAVAFLEYQTKRPLEIGFDPDRIVINSLIRQRYDWKVFNNVVLKDGLLTLDFKNNRLMQKEIADDDDDDDADEEEFNAWCRDQLADDDKRNVLPLHP
jgi:hypothetical protein